ncbi:MAG: helix-turn-helix transcriptional regulator [bacterium]|nr:helix-turn-helix transcriptional regulator [bacterium]
MLKPEHLPYLGAALNALRTRAGLTQAEVATRADSMYPPQISRYERGHEEPSMSSLVKYLSAIDADFADLQAELEQQARSSELEREVGSPSTSSAARPRVAFRTSRSCGGSSRR